MNRFKGLDLVNRVSEKLLTEIHNSVQEVANNTIPKKKKSKKAKWLSEEALQIAEERREAKKQGREGKVHPINTESQKIARRDKVKSLSRIRLFATPWTAAYQVPPSMGFSRQEY